MPAARRQGGRLRACRSRLGRQYLLPPLQDVVGLLGLAVGLVAVRSSAV
jgi:hypothetical protein